MAIDLPGDRERVVRVIRALQTQQTTQGHGPVQIDPVDGGAVLNVLAGLSKPVDVQVGPRQQVSRETWDDYEFGPHRSKGAE